MTGRVYLYMGIVIRRMVAANMGLAVRSISIDQVSPSDYDVIIAGTGAGGLLTALALSADGKRCLLLEKEDRIGGVWNGYWVNGFRVDRGLHVITRVRRGAFTQFMRRYLSPPPTFVFHEGWYFRVNDREGTIPSSIGQTLRWPLTGPRGRLTLARIGAKIKTMKLDEMRRYKDITFLEFMQRHNATNSTILDVIQSAIYMAAGVGVDRASAYEALRTLKDTDKESSRISSIKKLIFGMGVEFDEGYVVGGMAGLVKRVSDAIDGDVVLNAPVERISESNGCVSGVTVNGQELEHHCVVSNIPMSAMPGIVNTASPVARQFFERWSHMEATYGVTLWLGLDEVVIGDRKSRVIVYPTPNRWMVSVSSFDPSCAPHGKELVALATIYQAGKSIEEHVSMLKGNGLEKYHPRLLSHIEMEHVQFSYATRAALIPGQTDLDRPGPETPIKGLYIVGTDTAGSGVGLQQAASSANGVIAALRRNEFGEDTRH